MRRTIIGQLRPLAAAVVRVPPIWIAGDLVEDVIQGRRELLMDGTRVVAGDQVRRVAVALEERGQLFATDSSQQGRVGDLVAIEVQDRQDCAVADRVDELGGVPCRRQRPGFRFAVTDDTRHDQIGVVERGSVRVR